MEFNDGDDILYQLINLAYNFEKYHKLDDNVFFVLYLFNEFRVKDNHLTLIYNLKELLSILRKNSISELGFSIGNEGINYIINEQYKVSEWAKSWSNRYESGVSSHDELMKLFLIDCRENFKRTGNEDIKTLYTEGRKFCNKNNFIVTKNKLDDFINHFRNDPVLITLARQIESWYKPITDNLPSQIYTCPVCGSILTMNALGKFNCSKMCEFYWQEDNLEINMMDIEPNIKYYQIKNDIFKFTLIPAVSEVKLFNRLSHFFDDAACFLYPNIDEYDILLTKNSINIYIDVKDFKSLADLIDKLTDSGFFTKAYKTVSLTNSFVFLVIPEHIKVLFIDGDFIDILKRKLKDEQLLQSKYFSILYDFQVDEMVQVIFDE